MLDDASLDVRLRRMAATATEREAASVDVESAAAQLQRRLEGASADVAVGHDRGRTPRVALGVAAALLALLAAGALLALRGGGGARTPASEPPLPPSTLPSPVPTAAAPSTPAPSTTHGQTTVTDPGPSTERARAEPTEVRQGDVVTITPAGTITRACADTVTTIRRDGGDPLDGHISFGRWSPVADPTATTTIPDCIGTTSAGAVSLVIPMTMFPGVYDLCLADPGVTAGCATVTIEPAAQPADCTSEPTAPPSLADGAAPGSAVVEGDLARWGTEGSPGSVRQILRPAASTWLDDALASGRAITRGQFEATVVPVGDPPLGEITIYLRDAADGCIRTYNVGPGLYTADAESLARRWVDALDGRGVDAPQQSAIGVESYGWRAGIGIDRIAADGSVVGTLSEEEIAALTAPSPLPDGSRLTLAGDPADGRCVNRAVEAGGGSAAAVAALVPEARSLFVTDEGIAVMGRDVCGTSRWGGPGTHWELIAVDTALGDAAAPVVLLIRESDPDAIAYDDGNVIVAFGEMTPVGASLDEHYVSVRESYAPEGSRWHLVDLREPNSLVRLAGSCPIPGDIVGPPRFIDDATVVIARRCAPSRSDDPPPLYPLGDGDVHVDAVALDGSTPEGTVVWSAVPTGLRANSHSHVVGLDATIGSDGQIWAIVTGNGGVEDPSESFLLRGTETIDITRAGYDAFAFDPATLIWG